MKFRYSFSAFYTLVASYTNLGNDQYVSKTITGFTVGQMFIIGHKSSSSNPEFCEVRIESGSNIGMSLEYGYSLGTGPNALWEAATGALAHDHIGRTMSFVCVATATSVSIGLYDVDNNETIYIYR